MAKFYVSIEHRLIGGSDSFTTSAIGIEARTISEAIEIVTLHGVRQGHEVIGVHASPETDEK
jgi:hypothetical protein